LVRDQAKSMNVGLCRVEGISNLFPIEELFFKKRVKLGATLHNPTQIIALHNNRDFIYPHHPSYFFLHVAGHPHFKDFAVAPVFVFQNKHAIYLEFLEGLLGGFWWVTRFF